MAFFNLIGGLKGSIVLVLILALSGYIWKLKHDTDVVNRELTQVKVERDSAATARDAAIGISKTNENTINQLKNERDLVQSALSNLETSKAENKVVIDKVKTIIKSQDQLPENKALLSPVLKDTVNQIQLNRDKRKQP